MQLDWQLCAHLGILFDSATPVYRSHLLEVQMPLPHWTRQAFWICMSELYDSDTEWECIAHFLGAQNSPVTPQSLLNWGPSHLELHFYILEMSGVTFSISYLPSTPPLLMVYLIAVNLACKSRQELSSLLHVLSSLLQVLSLLLSTLVITYTGQHFLMLTVKVMTAPVKVMTVPVTFVSVYR